VFYVHGGILHHNPAHPFHVVLAAYILWAKPSITWLLLSCRYIAALRGRLLYVVLYTVCKVERIVLTVLNEYYYYYYY